MPASPPAATDCALHSAQWLLQVLTEISNATKSFPNAYIRLVAFDNVRQVQVSSFLVHRPSSARDFRAPEERSV